MLPAMRNGIGKPFLDADLQANARRRRQAAGPCETFIPASSRDR